MSRKALIITTSAIVLVALAAVFTPTVWRHVRYPYYCKYIRQLQLSPSEARDVIGRPSELTEWRSSLYLSAFSGDWERVLKLTELDRQSEIGTYYHNLARAMTANLYDNMMEYYQPFERGLFLLVNDTATPFQIGCSAEVWYRIGALTMAEHSYMLGLIFSPHHYSTCAIMRLAEINLIRGDDAAATKYLRMLLRERAYRKWAADRMPGQQTLEVQQWIQQRRTLLPETDVVHYASSTRTVLRNLLQTNPSNRLAVDYLLCYDILVKDLESFVSDYQSGPGPVNSRLYQEAVMIYLASHDELSPEAFEYFAIPDDVVRDFSSYSQQYSRCEGDMKTMHKSWGNSYWFYYRYARRNEK